MKLKSSQKTRPENEVLYLHFPAVFFYILLNLGLFVKEVFIAEFIRLIAPCARQYTDSPLVPPEPAQ